MTRFARTGDRLVDAISPTLVLVEFNMPYSVSGVTERNYHGTGVVLDAVRGLVAVDRNTVPVAIGDVRLTFAGTIEVDGTVEYVHPLHNLAVVRYDPRQLGDTPVKSVQLAARVPTTGEQVSVVGLQADNRVVSQQATVASIGPVQFPLSRTLQFRDANLEVDPRWSTARRFRRRDRRQTRRGARTVVELRLRERARARAAQHGRAGRIVQEMLEYARDGRTLYSAEAEFSLLSLAEARRLGLDEQWIARLSTHNPQNRQVLSIERLVAGSPAAGAAAAGRPVARGGRKGRQQFRGRERSGARAAGHLDALAFRRRELRSRSRPSRCRATTSIAC